MGCFLACFGYSNKHKKRRKSGIRILSQDQGHGSYEPLHKEVAIALNITEDPVKEKPKYRLGSKIKKRVSFNLNVKTYEPIPNDETVDFFADCNETNTWDESREESVKSVISLFTSEEKSMESRMASNPANYRYQKCNDIHDEEDGIRFEESDLDVDDDDDVSDTDEEDGWGIKDEEDNGTKICEFEFIEQLNSPSNGSNIEDKVQLPAQKNKKLMPLDIFSVQDLKKFEGNCSARDRRQYVHSVLNPVENLSQWKAMKARSVQLYMQQKENI